MKTIAKIFLVCMALNSLARGEEFFATAQEALVLGEIALRQNGIDPKGLILYRMEIKPANPNRPEKEGVWKQIDQQMGDRDAWLLMYHSKEGFTPMRNYGFSHAVLLLSKTEAAVIVTKAEEP